LFKKAVGISGRYDLTNNIGDFKDLMDGFHSEGVYFNMPAQYMANLNDDRFLQAVRNMEIILAVGETDPFLSENQYLSSLLWEKGIPNQFHTWESNAHRPHYWRKMVPMYI